MRFREIDRYDDSRQLERLGAAPAEGNRQAEDRDRRENANHAPHQRA